MQFKLHQLKLKTAILEPFVWVFFGFVCVLCFFVFVLFVCFRGGGGGGGGWLVCF